MQSAHTTWKITLLLAFLPLFSFGQNHWEASLSAGVVNYLGDLVEPAFTMEGAQPALQLNLRRQFDANHAMRLNVLAGSLNGDDARSERLAARGYSFETSLLEFSLIGELDPWGQKRYPKKEGFTPRLTPVFFAGLALALASPEVNYGTEENIDATIDYPGWHVAVPVGALLRKDLNSQLSVQLESSLRFTLTDNLDGVQLSGNANRNDAYFYFSIGAGYRFVEKIAPAEQPVILEAEPTPVGER